MMFQCLVQLGIKSWYELNKDYVATVLCENQDKPQLQCNGKCYLKKQIEKTSEKQEKNTGNEEIHIVHFVLPEQWNPASYTFNQTKEHNTRYIACAGTATVADVFHPPQQV